MSLITKSTYLRGPKGDIGLAGPRGERGLTGAQGLQGPAGAPDPQFIRNQISATGNITYNQATGAIGFTNPGYATTTYVDTAIANLVSGAPDLLNTLNELAAAIGDNADFINSVIVKTGGTMTGALILNADPITNLSAATKQYVDQATSSIVTSYNDLTDKPTLFDGVYSSLSGKPTLFDGVYSSLSGKPTLFSGSYTDLTSKPDLSLKADLSYVEAADDLLSIALDLKANTADLSLVATSGSYNDLTDIPTPALSDRLVNGSKQVVLQSNGYIRLVNGAQLYDYGSGTGNGYGITDSLGSTYIGYDPTDTLGALHMDSYSGGNIRIRTTTLPNTYNDWLYSSDGVLSIPTGGDIKRNGVSVLNSFSGSYADLTNKPTLFSGSYTDLTDKPAIPSDINQLSDTNGLLGSSGSTANIQSYNYDATSGQSVFTGQGENQQALLYTDLDFVQVFKNGVLLRKNAQYILNDNGYVDYMITGDSIELTTPAALNDWIYIIVTNTTTSSLDSMVDGGAYTDTGDVIDGGSY